jgi:trehalose/maltose hydrolase-like predicted phosphorylase
VHCTLGQLGVSGIVRVSARTSRSTHPYYNSLLKFQTCRCYNYEYHLENDISLAQYQYYAGTQNETWLREKGWPVISAIADFWVSQVVYNASTAMYDTFDETDRELLLISSETLTEPSFLDHI